MKQDTKLIALGRAPVRAQGPVNLPVHRASTILSENLDGYVHRFDGDNRFNNVIYGSTGTQNSRALAEAVAAVESGHRHGGDRQWALGGDDGGIRRRPRRRPRARSGFRVRAYPVVLRRDPLPLRGRNEFLRSRDWCRDRGGDAREHPARLQPRRPGSLTFRDAGCAAIAKAAHERGALVAMDNTWATPLYFRPLEHGVDISIQAGTKYFAGHSDLVIGMITTATDELFKTIADQTFAFGDSASPDDCFLALRGMRSLSVRLERQSASAMKVARWLEARSEVKQVLYPALESDPGHALWKRDFGGASSLFGLGDAHHRRGGGRAHGERIRPVSDRLLLGRIREPRGLQSNADPPHHRSLDETPFLLRMHIGLEDPDDLIADLEAGLGRPRFLNRSCSHTSVGLTSQILMVGRDLWIETATMKDEGR